MDKVNPIPADPDAAPLGSEAAARRRDSVRAAARGGGLPAEGGRYATAIRVVSVLTTLALSEWFGRDVNPIFFPSPTAIFKTVPGMLRSGELVDAFLSSMQPFAVGFVSAIVIGVLMGLLMGRYRLVENMLEAQITALYSTPNVAL